MKKIGLVGGTGPESTLMYYKELNSRIDYLTGGKEMPDIAIESVNFRKAWDYVSGGKYRELSSYLSEKVNMLKQSGGTHYIKKVSHQFLKIRVLCCFLLLLFFCHMLLEVCFQIFRSERLDDAYAVVVDVDNLITLAVKVMSS